jgi:hypothetical protein
MPRKKKDSVAEPEPEKPEPDEKLDVEIIIEMDTVYQALKEKWLELAATEKIGFTKELTKRLDKLQLAIAKRKEDIRNEYM